MHLQLRALGPVGGLAVGIALLALAACASGGGESGGAAAPDDAPGSGGAAGVGGAAGKAGASGGTIVADATPSCDVGKLVYLSTIERKLLGFDPKSLAITPIGDIVCPAASSSVPFGLAIDVKGTLWIPYNDGAIYQLTLGDMSCKKSGYKPLQSGWERFKVAFLGDAASPTGETLYASDLPNDPTKTPSQGLGRISPDLVLTPIANYSAPFAHEPATITGRRDGRLFAFFFGSAGRVVAEVDPATAALKAPIPQPITLSDHNAVAQWGGAYWIFTSVSDGVHSTIDKLVVGKGTKRVVEDAGYTIKGAAVSTCAPTAQPDVK